MSDRDAPTQEENKQTVLRQIEALHSGDLDAAADLTHPDFLNHEAASSRATGPEGLRESFRRLRAAFAGVRLEPLDLVAEADRVVVRARFSGRHVGVLAGVQPTGREFSVEQIHIWRLAGGKIIEHWASRDDYGLLQQLAVLPEPEQDGAPVRDVRSTPVAPVPPLFDDNRKESRCSQ